MRFLLTSQRRKASLHGFIGKTVSPGACVKTDGWSGYGDLKAQTHDAEVIGEYAANSKARVLGKPSPDFFRLAAADMGLAPASTVMIGDDAEFDVSAAIGAGLQGILARTGKYKPGAENGLEPKPDVVTNNLLDAIDLIAKGK